MSEQNDSGGGPSRPKRRRRRGGGGQGGGQGGQGGNQGRRRSRRGGGQRGGQRGGGVIDRIPEGEPDLDVNGVLHMAQQGHGHLRTAEAAFAPEQGDCVVPREIIRQFNLEEGVELTGKALAKAANGAPALCQLEQINGLDCAEWEDRTLFKDLVAESPSERIRLEADPEDLSTRVVDLIAPIGKGQRCLIVAPPKAGKTVLLQRIANSVTANHPEIHLMVLLVDERPEEVTDMRRNIQGEVIASSSDESAKNHIRATEAVLERAKRLVESGRDVLILLDSITRLARAYNSEQRSSGRILSGGIDARTMEKPRRFFGAARKAEGGGSLTVIGTALVDTGSRMDEVIFQEFKGTGNTEIVMDRKLFDMRVFPAIDIAATGTRREEMLLTPHEYEKITLLRRALSSLKALEAMQLLTDRLSKHKTNAEFLDSMV